MMMVSIKQQLINLGYDVVKVKSTPCRMAIFKNGQQVHKTPYASVDLAIELLAVSPV